MYYVETLLIIVSILICYYINRYFLRSNLKRGNTYTWEMMITNLVISIIIPMSICYWIIIGINKLPKFKDTPPNWL